jgi:hypothetical protein
LSISAAAQGNTPSKSSLSERRPPFATFFPWSESTVVETMGKSALRKAKRIPRVKTLRRALGFTQEEFAGHYQIPIGPLKIIARDPECVHRLLNPDS